MRKHLQKFTFQGEHRLDICGSKSESNRLLILQALFSPISINNLSTADDTVVLQAALQSNSDIIDIHHAGTAMRFLTAYLAFYTQKPVTLTGSKRMQDRPIGVLVDALHSLGAKIEYIHQKGYPPLKIYPGKIVKKEVELQADISSQYISALMLAASKLPKGLKINFSSKPTSLPYINMTVELMRKVGLKIDFQENYIQILPSNRVEEIEIDVESDWSSASYFYSLVALSPDLTLELSTYKKFSLQGDAKLAKLYEPLGVETTFENNRIILKNSKRTTKSIYKQNLNHTPDLAQTIALTCLGLNIDCYLSGLHTLKIKETDRLVALKTEIEKFGAKVKIDDHSLKLFSISDLEKKQYVDTYKDHRMAMAFAPLSARVDLFVNNPEVVSKSYPKFWEDFHKLLN